MHTQLENYDAQRFYRLLTRIMARFNLQPNEVTAERANMSISTDIEPLTDLSLAFFRGGTLVATKVACGSQFSDAVACEIGLAQR